MQNARKPQGACTPAQTLPCLEIQKYPNGGWIVRQGAGEIGVSPERIGAYTDTDDLLAALTEVLGDDAT